MGQKLRNGAGDPDEPPEEWNGSERSRGSGVIFAVVAIALILAISFFYLTKDRRSEPANALIEAADSPDSAARVVGDAAENAADRVRNR